MKYLIAVAAFAVLLPSAALADKKPYTLADLKALVSAKSYKEAVEHLKDVAPADRNAEWQDIAATAAGGYIGGLKDDNLVTKVLEIEKLDQDHPAILTPPKYTKVRAEIGLKAYEACFKNSYWIDECLQHAMKFLEGDAGNTDLAFKMAKQVRRNANAYGAVPFFKRALAGKNAAAVCKDDDLKLAVIAGLGLPADYDNAADSRTIASGVCWDALKKPVLDAFNDESSGGYVKENACAVLKAKKVLTADQAKTCK
jgi:hypothetical protein